VVRRGPFSGAIAVAVLLSESPAKTESMRQCTECVTQWSRWRVAVGYNDLLGYENDNRNQERARMCD